MCQPLYFTRRSTHGFYGLALVLIVAALVFLVVQENPAQVDTSTEADNTSLSSDCDELVALMSTGQTPYDYAFGGGELDFELESGMATVSSALMADDWADYYIFSKANGPATLALDFSESELTLEAGVFYGVTPLDGGFKTVVPDETLSFTLDSGSGTDAVGVHTIVVRRPHVTDDGNVGRYTFTATVSGASVNEAVQLPPPAQQESELSEINLIGGQQQIRFNSGATALVNAGSVSVLADRRALRAINFRGVEGQIPAEQRVVLPELAETYYAGGGIAANWQGEQGPLTLYVETMAYNRPIQDLLAFGVRLNANSPFALDTRYNLLESLYVLDGCFGFKLRAVGGDGTTFIAPLDAASTDRRFVIDNLQLVEDASFTYPQCSDYDIFLTAPDSEGATVPYYLCIDWQEIASGSTVTLVEGVFSADLVDDRKIALQTATLRTFRRNPEQDDELTNLATPPLTVEFDDIEDETVQLRLDWQNLDAFRYENPGSEAVSCALPTDQPGGEATPEPDTPAETINTFGSALRCITLDFVEADSVRTITRRPGNGLARLDALENVIQISYRPGPGETVGEERLLLPAQETYVELVTPALDTPTFNGADFDVNALPGQPGFSARHANNLGAECYLFPTLHPEANCTTNGYPNPANGNLWYSITDHSAHGALFDLTLTRSYNSGDAGIEGPFGLGWVSSFLPDYKVAYDEAQNSRPITVENSGDYRTGLDLIWAPRGLVTYTAPSGSRHVFVQAQAAEGIDLYESLTMPGWVLFRTDVRSAWQLYQNNGLLLTFDRAGRLRAIEYPDRSRQIQIAYNFDLDERINGPGGYGESNAVTISDSFENRQLELYFDIEHHIYRSVLRDRTTQPDFRLACDLSDNCYETLYKYEEDRLVQVIYPNGQEAIYTYDENHRLVAHNDPRAPIAPVMRYSYDESGRLLTAQIDGEQAPANAGNWLSLNYAAPGETVVTTEAGDETRYSFTRAAGDWDDAAVGYRLNRINGPLDMTRVYRWSPTSTTIDINDGTSTRSLQFEYVDLESEIFSAETPIITRHVRRILESNASGQNIHFLLNEPALVVVGSVGDDFLFTTSAGTWANQPQYVTFADGTFHRYDYEQRGNSMFVSRLTVDGAFDSDEGRFVDARSLYSIQYDSNNYLDVVRRFLVDVNGFTIPDMNFGYDYNALGLMTIYQQQLPTGGESYILNYSYDGLGQITRILDTELGTYRIRTETLDCADSTICREITVTDPNDAVMIYRFDGRDSLIEMRLQEDRAGALLRRTSYRYDSRGRLTAEIQHLADVDCDPTQTENANCLVTRYVYEAPGDGISHRITRIDAEGRESTHEYDARGRLIRTRDEAGRESTFAHDANSQTITQTERYGEAEVRTTYDFDEFGRLNRLIYPAGGNTVRLNWGISYQINKPNRLGFGAQGAEFVAFDWDWTNGFVTSMALLDTANTQIVINAAYDGLDALRQWQVREIPQGVGTDASLPDRFNTVEVTRCNEVGGEYRMIYHRQSGETSQPAACDLVGNNIDAIYRYDAHGRLLQVVDEFGTRRYTYERSTTEAYRWRITMAATPSDGTAAEPLTWVFVTNFAGDIMRWTDESGITRTYTYDLIGRVTGVSTTDATDAANIQVRYNRVGQVIEIRDGLGRLTCMTYDAGGRLVEEVHAQTTRGTTCANLTGRGTSVLETVTTTYNERGLVSIVERQRGDSVQTVNYSYEHPDDPTLLTGFVDAEGHQHRFEWVYPEDMRNHALNYTGPTGAVTRYTFNGLGQIDDVTVRSGDGNIEYTWQYDGQGYLAVYNPPSVPVFQAELEGPAEGTLEIAYRAQRTPAYAANNLLQLIISANNINDSNSGERTRWRRLFSRLPLGLVSDFESAGTLAFKYDPLARLQALATTTRSGSAAYAWALAQQSDAARVRLDLPGTEATLSYDALDRLRSIVTGESRLDYRYITPENGDSRLEIREDGVTTAVYRFLANATRYDTTGLTQRLTYDAWDRLIAVETMRCEPGAGLGCVSGETETISYTYDGDTVTVTQADGTVEVFEYDAAGNLISYTVEGTRYIYGYDSAHRLTHIDSPEGTRLQFFYRPRQMEVAAICRGTTSSPWDDLEDCEAETAVIERYGYNGLLRLTARVFTGYDVPTDEDLRDAFDAPAGTLTREGAFYSYTPFGLLDGTGVLGFISQQVRSTLFQEMRYSEDGLGLLTSRNTNIGPAAESSAAPGQRYTLRYEANPLPQLDYLVRLLAIEDQSENPEPYANYAYEYDAQGRVSTVTIGDTILLQYTYTPAEVTVADQAQPALRVTLPLLGERETLAIVPSARMEDIGGYSSTFTIDPASGLRVTERRVYPNGVEIDAEYQYQPENTNRSLHPGLPLISQTLTVNGAGATGDPQFDRNGQEIAANRHRFYYDYDTRGNLVRIVYLGPLSTSPIPGDTRGYVNLTPVTCRTFQYDGANRLTAVLNGTGEVQARYAYDIYDRLVRVGETRLVYINDARVPALAYDVNGNGVLLDPEMVPQGWAFDSAGRFVSTTGAMPVLTVDDLCRLGLPATAPNTSTGVTLFDGMVTDPAMGLAFIDGRAYFPAIGRFLQRDPQGPDVRGLVYDYPARQIVLPIPTSRPGVEAGLEVLQHALAALPENRTTNVASIKDDLLPQLDLRMDGLSSALSQQGRQVDQALRDIMDLPIWIMRHVNGRTPQFDPASGRVTWDHLAAPGQGESTWGYVLNLDAPLWSGRLPGVPPLHTPADILNASYGYSQAAFLPPTTVVTQVGVHDTHAFSNVLGLSMGTPLRDEPFVTLRERLTERWLRPDYALADLEATAALVAQRDQLGLGWVEESLRLYLPAWPILPEVLVSPYRPGINPGVTSFRP
ncbi:MAG: hypothetical protein OHK0046_34380 [Anaerolineae bacterium]